MARTRVAALLAASLLAATPAAASDRAFFDSIEGSWSGPGEIVAGKYRGTRFSCSLDGRSLRGDGMSLDGSCRVGIFSQAIKASVERHGRGYRGSFLDGAKGKGLDVTDGNVHGDRITVGMERPELSGAMVARVKPDGRLSVTVSVHVGDQLVPVLGMDLSRRLDGVATGSIR